MIKMITRKRACAESPLCGRPVLGVLIEEEINETPLKTMGFDFAFFQSAMSIILSMDLYSMKINSGWLAA